MKQLVAFWAKIKQKTSQQLLAHFKYIYVSIGILSIVLFAFVYVFSPKYEVLKVNGTEVKRTNKNEKLDMQSKDVYYIYTINDGTPLVLKNEDALAYFKFNSADIQTLAQDLVGQLAEVKYYGWRSTWFSIFPNITDISPAKSGDTSISVSLWFNLLLLLSLIGFIFFKLRQFQQKLNHGSI